MCAWLSANAIPCPQQFWMHLILMILFKESLLVLHGWQPRWLLGGKFLKDQHLLVWFFIKWSTCVKGIISEVNCGFTENQGESSEMPWHSPRAICSVILQLAAISKKGNIHMVWLLGVINHMPLSQASPEWQKTCPYDVPGLPWWIGSWIFHVLVML